MYWIQSLRSLRYEGAFYYGRTGSDFYPKKYPEAEIGAASEGNNRELAQDETITGGLILGYGYDGQPVRSELKRTGNPVTWVGNENEYPKSES